MNMLRSARIVTREESCELRYTLFARHLKSTTKDRLLIPWITVSVTGIHNSRIHCSISFSHLRNFGQEYKPPVAFAAQISTMISGSGLQVETSMTWMSRMRSMPFWVSFSRKSERWARRRHSKVPPWFRELGYRFCFLRRWWKAECWGYMRWAISGLSSEQRVHHDSPEYCGYESGPDLEVSVTRPLQGTWHTCRQSSLFSFAPQDFSAPLCSALDKSSTLELRSTMADVSWGVFKSSSSSLHLLLDVMARASQHSSQAYEPWNNGTGREMHDCR